jgi:hypothetical protein
MKFDPSNGDLVDFFLSEHSERRIYERFPTMKFEENANYQLLHCVSPTAPEMWAFKIRGGYIIGRIEKAKETSRLDGIFIIQTALQDWQFKRSKFVPDKYVVVHMRGLNSQIQNKIKSGKLNTIMMPLPVRSSNVLEANA